MPQERKRAQGAPGLDRDLRLDACRGIALWFTFLNHIPDNICSWLTLRHYGFSDTSEIFMFVSGVTCAVAYDGVRRNDGWLAVIGHTLRRGWEIYAAFLILTIACVAMVHLAGKDQFGDVTNTRVVLDQPGEAIVRALILQYRPVNTDVLPTFVLFHLLFAPLLWLLLKAPNLTLAMSFVVYLLVQIFGWNLREWPRNDWYFNPFAWQLLVVLGAWWATGGKTLLWRLATTRAATTVAAMYLLFSLIVTLGWDFKSLESLIPQPLAQLIYPVNKPDLDPLRLLHFLALALLVAKFVRPDWQVLTSSGLRPAIRCGENSLDVYCVGVVLALVAHIVLETVSRVIAMQVLLSIGGIAFMIVFATFMTWIRINSREKPKLF
ncbi:OpgC domain-containing protein [Bradyrhizobium cenepequi]